MNKPISNEEKKALAAAYAGEVPVSAKTILAALTDADRRTAVERLVAVTAAVSGGNRSALASSLQISRQSFYDLLRKWKRYGIAGLIPRQSRAPRALTTSERYAEIAMRFLRAAPGDIRNVDVARRVLWVDDRRRRRAGEPLDVGPDWAGYGRRHRVETSGSEASPASVRGRLLPVQRGVEHARRRLAKDARYLRRAYGRAVVIDCSGTNVLIGSNAADAALGLVCVVLERASGAILGAAIGAPRESASVQREAIRGALAYLREEICDRAGESGASAGIVMTPAPGSRVDRGLIEASDSVTPEKMAERMHGHRLVQTIGPRIGRVVLHPRFIRGTWDADRFKLLLLERSEAEAYWRREVLRHNEPIIEALIAAGLAGSGRGERRAGMAAALERAAASLRADEEGDRGRNAG